MLMGLVSYTQNIAEGVSSQSLPTLDEVTAIFNAYLQKKASKGKINGIRERLLIKAKALLRDTKRLNGLLKKGETAVELNALTGLKRTPSFWAGHTLSLPLLSNAIHQLEVAKNIPDMLLGIYGLLAIAEDKDFQVKSGTHTDMKNMSIYHYLTRIADWTPERRREVFAGLDLLMNKTLMNVAKRVTQKLSMKSTRRPIPMPW